MPNAIVTDHVDSVTYDYILDNAQDMVYDAFVGLNLFMKNSRVIFHGGSDTLYPHITTGIETNYYDIMKTGAIAQVTPTTTDLFDSAHQAGWGIWVADESISPEEHVKNVGSWAKNEAVISLKKGKNDALMNQIGYSLDQNIFNGDGTNNTILGLVEVFDITSANYLGWAFNGAHAAYRPSNTTIAVDYTALTMADIFEAYGDIEDKGRNAETILLHTDVLKKLRTLTENTVDRSQGGNATIGQLNFDVLGADVVTSLAMPTTTSTKIYFINWGKHPGRGVRGDSKHSVPEGKNWVMEFGGPAPLGFTTTGWFDATKAMYWGTLVNIAWGAFKMACTKPQDQAYISIA